MAEATGHHRHTGTASPRVTTLISLTGVVALLRHRIRERLARDETGWAFENLRYLPDGQIDVSHYLAVLLTELLAENRSAMRHPCPQGESEAVLRHMGLDEEDARALNREMFSAALDRILEHLPQSAFNDCGDYDFLLTPLDLIAIRSMDGSRSPARSAP